jgi:hypothetical protein
VLRFRHLVLAVSIPDRGEAPHLSFIANARVVIVASVADFARFL